MAYFEKGFIEFFTELEKNNEREWYHANKANYEKYVKKPFELFVTDLIKLIQKHDKNVQVEAKQCIFRIYRDVRFSKDKTPYKLNTSAIIGKDGRKGGSIPGSYVEMSHKHFRFYGGCYNPEKQNLMDIRYEIANNPAAFKNLYNNKNFKKHYGDLRGARNKILPADLKEPALTEPYILNKQFYYFEEMDPSILLSDDLMKVCEKNYLASQPMLDFLTKAGGYAEL